MKIGGKFYLADVQRQRRFSYSRALNRRARQAHQQAVQHFNQVMVSAHVHQGQEMTRMAIQQAGKRLQAEFQTRIDSFAALQSNLQSARNEAQGGIDLRV